MFLVCLPIKSNTNDSNILQASPFIQQTSRHPIFFEEQNFEDVIIDVDGNIITVSEDMVYESDTSGPLQTTTRGMSGITAMMTVFIIHAYIQTSSCV